MKLGLALGKRSSFPRIEKDAYQTIDPRAVEALLPVIFQTDALCLTNGFVTLQTQPIKYAEPCVGEGKLEAQLTMNQKVPMDCVWASDIQPNDWFQCDALSLTSVELHDADVIITNPPWSRDILHKMIDHFRMIKPTWLLFDADWCHTVQSIPFMEYCTDIVSVGRLRWIPGTKMQGKDNVQWYRFHKYPAETRFHRRTND